MIIINDNRDRFIECFLFFNNFVISEARKFSAILQITLSCITYLLPCTFVFDFISIKNKEKKFNIHSNSQQLYKTAVSHDLHFCRELAHKYQSFVPYNYSVAPTVCVT